MIDVRDLHFTYAHSNERIGVSFEAPNHFLKLTGLENLRYFAALYHGPTRVPAALLESIGLQNSRPADRRASSRLNQSRTWFQLAKR